MPAWFAIAIADLRMLSRDRMGLFWVLAFPVLFAVFFGSILRAAVEDRTARLRVVVVEAPASARADRLSLQLVAMGVDVVRADLDQARERVRLGRAAAFVHASPEPAGAVAIGVDPLRRVEGAMLRGLVLQALSPEFTPFALEPPSVELASVVGQRDGPRSGYELVFPAMVLWGLMGCAATFSVSLVVERNRGTWLRLRAAPVRRASLLAGKAAACLAACMLTASLLTALGAMAFGVQFASPLALGAALASTAVCFTGMTTVLATLGNTEHSVAAAGWSTLIVMAMLGGAMVPASLMPEWLLPASELSPVRWAIVALEGATWRHCSWSELQRPLGLLCAAGVGAFLAGALRLEARQG